MQHNYDIRASIERCAVAGFLVGAVTFIVIVGNRNNTKLLGKLQCLIGTCVVHKDNVVYDIDRDLGERPSERERGIKRRQNNTKSISNYHHLTYLIFPLELWKFRVLRVPAVDYGVVVAVDALPPGEVVEHGRGRARRLEQGPGDRVMVKQPGQFLADPSARRGIAGKEFVAEEVGPAIYEGGYADEHQIAAEPDRVENVAGKARSARGVDRRYRRDGFARANAAPIERERRRQKSERDQDCSRHRGSKRCHRQPARGSLSRRAGSRRRRGAQLSGERGGD